MSEPAAQPHDPASLVILVSAVRDPDGSYTIRVSRSARGGTDRSSTTTDDPAQAAALVERALHELDGRAARGT